MIEGKIPLLVATFLGLLLFNPVFTPAEETAPQVEQPHALGQGPHLFLDGSLTRREENVRRKIQQPTPHPDNPVVRREYPWESLRAHAFGNVIFDAQAKRFRMWYLPYGPEWKPSKLGYAESIDGLNWSKPMFDLHPFQDFKTTNIVLAPPGGTNCACLFEDTHETDPAKRFKALFDTYTSAGRVQKVAFSPDGIHWNPPAGIQVLAGKKDSGISAFWSERLGKYIAYVRGYDPPPKPDETLLPVRRRRVIDYTESRDFLKWSNPITVFRTDARDGDAAIQPYGMAVTPYGDLFIGMLWILHIQRMIDFREIGTIDVQLTVSRDGRTWNRVGGRETFLPLGREGEWDDEERRTMQSFLLHNDTISIYYTGCSEPHAAASRASIGLATLPADRFLAVGPLFAGEPAVIETKLLHASKGTVNQLLINATIPPGAGLRVEALDEKGRKVSGFESETCHLTQHDKLRYRVTWKEGRTLANLLQIVPKFRLRFRLDGACRLFAFQAVKSPAG